MKRFTVGFVFFALALTASSVHAAQTTLSLSQPFKVNGAWVASGDYRVELAPSLDSMQLLQGHKVVASSPCRVTLVGGKLAGDEVHSRPDSEGHDVIVAVVLARSRMSIELLPSASSESAAGLASATR